MADNNSGGTGAGGTPLPLIGKRVIVKASGIFTKIIGNSSSRGHLILENCKTTARTCDLLFLRDGLSDGDWKDLLEYFTAKKQKNKEFIVPEFVSMSLTKMDDSGDVVAADGDVLSKIMHKRVVLKSKKEICVSCRGEVQEGEAANPTAGEVLCTICMKNNGEDEDEDAEKEAEAEEGANGEGQAGGERRGDATARGTGTGANDTEGGAGAGGGDKVVMVGGGGTKGEFQRLWRECDGDAEAFQKTIRDIVHSARAKVVGEWEAKLAQLGESAETFAAKAVAFEMGREGGGDLNKDFKARSDNMERIAELEKDRDSTCGQKGPEDEVYASIRGLYDGEIEKCNSAKDEATGRIKMAYRESKRRCLGREKDDTPGKVKAIADAVFDEHVVKARLDF